MFRQLLLLSLLVVSGHVTAEDEFYSARIPVTDRSESALSEAASAGLTQVLIRVSGDEKVATLPGMDAAIDDARNRMSLYSYQESEGSTELLARFDGNFVKGLLRKSGATFWGESRPPVLLWIVVDEPYSRRFATVSEDENLLKTLAAEFARRGIRLRLPLLDLEDASALTPEMVWQKVIPRIRAASERYGTEHILVGRYVELSSGQQIADWLYMDANTSKDLQLQGKDPRPILLGAVDMVVDQMAEQFAVKLEPVSTFERIEVSVSGVRSYSDYRGVLAALGDISVLDGIQVASVAGEDLELNIVGVGTADALARLLPTKSRLVIVGEASGQSLNLKWGQP